MGVRRPVFVMWCSALLVSFAAAPRADAAPSDQPPAAESAQADTPFMCPICHSANKPDAPYAEKAGSTLARGATNTLFGWTELLLQPAAEVNEGGNVLAGVGKGIGNGVKRTALGVGELLTFWAPKGRGGYQPITKDCPICMTTTAK